MLCYGGPELGRYKSPSESNFRRIWGGYRTLLICSLSYYVGNKTLGFQAGVLYTLLWMVAYSTPSYPLSKRFNHPHRNARRWGWFFLGFRGDTICIPVRLRVVLAQFFMLDVNVDY